MSVLEHSSGSVEKVFFPKLLWDLYLEQVNGILTLSRGEFQKRIFFQDGQPVHAESNLLHETLGRYLVTEGCISEAQEREGNSRAFQEQRLLGDVLIEMGAIEAASLFELLRKNFAIKILDCFSWESGEFAFDPKGLEEMDQPSALKMNLGRLILKGVRLYFPLTRIESGSQFSSEKSFRVTKTQNAQGNDAFQLTAEELGVLARFRSPKTVEEVIRESDLPREAIVRMLYAFSVLGLLEPAGNLEEVSLDELVGATLLQTLSPTEPEVSVSEADDETRELANHIAQDHMRLMELNYFELFGLPEDATAVTIRDQFVEFSAKYNPGRFRKGALGEFQHLGEEIFLRGVKAFGVLSDFDTKTKYLDKIKADRKTSKKSKKKPGEAFKIQTALLDGDSQFKKGVQFLKSKKFTQAIEFFEYAKDIDSKNPTYLSHLGWAIFQKDPERNHGKAEEWLRKARDLGSNADAAFYLGKFLLAQEQKKEALEHLQVAVDLSPKNIDMVRELRNAKRNAKK